jgi:glycosyltransferase involved in cell wall biosynthesis
MSVSVVIPAYNSSKFIAQTLESVLAQTYAAKEVLVIDDGSTDDTATIAEQFGAPVRVIRRQNARQAASRNFGVAEATGEWIAFVDADDIWESFKLERQMAELALHPDADVCYAARTELIHEEEDVRLGKYLPVPAPEELRECLFEQTGFLPSTVVIRRSVFLAMNGFDTRFKIVEDWDLWLRLLDAGIRFVACNDALVRYRIHPASVSHSGMVMLREQDVILRERVLPRLPWFKRSLHYQKVFSGKESSAAYVLRKVGDDRHLWVMSRSLLRWPYGDPHRYKVLAHMLFTRLVRDERQSNQSPPAEAA